MRAPEEKPRLRGLEEYESLWAFVSRIIAFLLGCTILGWQVTETHDRLWLILAGIGLCGPTVAASMATIVEAVAKVIGRGQ